MHSLFTRFLHGCLLTYLSPMDFPISIGSASLFQILEVLGGIFHFYSNSNRTFCKQTLETLIRRRVLERRNAR